MSMAESVNLVQKLNRNRSIGIAVSKRRLASESGEMSGELWEFVNTVYAYKTANSVDHQGISWSEVFDLMLFLGYRKVVPQAKNISDVDRIENKADDLTRYEYMTRLSIEGERDYLDEIPTVATLPWVEICQKCKSSKFKNKPCQNCIDECEPENATTCII